jgi:hypothetical protein
MLRSLPIWTDSYRQWGVARCARSCSLLESANSDRLTREDFSSFTRASTMVLDFIRLGGPIGRAGDTSDVLLN